MTNKELVVKIIEKLGGKENILSVENCMTRLRLDIKSIEKVNINELKKLEGVLGVVEGDGVQVVVGPGKSAKLCTIMKEDLGVKEITQNVGEWEANKEKIK